ncbi:MAG: hypothetical protein Q9170_003111 [Blastenia crenularia]
MLSHGVLAFLAPALLLGAGVQADGIYSKTSAVLQVDGKSYDKLVAKSNQVSNLKPAYEKAAKGLDGLAQVAAVNCDDDGNKAFCGSMGVQGFPTLKIVKPSKKPGKPTVEDYQGGRTTKDIVDAVKQAIPNNVKRISDKGLNPWLNSDNDTAKAILFSDKGTTSALIKVVATDYLGRINFAQIRNKETAALEMFGITTYPSLVVLPGGAESPILFDGSFSKPAMKDFLDQYASSTKSASAEKPKKEQKPLVDQDQPSATPAEAEETAASDSASSAFSSASSSHAAEEATAAPDGATTETVDDASQPTESPDPNAVSEDIPKPAPMPDIAPPIPALIERTFLERRCLGPKTTTCILALLPGATEEEQSSLPDDAAKALGSLAEIAEKHAERGSKLFPFFSVPARNEGQGALRDALKLDKEVELIAVNARRGWYRRYDGVDGYRKNAVESWVDAIRLGEGAKASLPEVLIVDEKEAEEEKVKTLLDICDSDFVGACRRAAIEASHKGQYEKAERMLRKLSAAQDKVHGKEAMESLRIMFELACVLDKRGRHEDAEAQFNQLLSMRRKALGLDHPHVVDTMAVLADVSWTQGRLHEAEKLMEQGKLEDARDLFEQSLYDGEDEQEPHNLDHLNILDNLASVYEDLGQDVKAEAFYKRAFTFRVQRWGSEHPETLDSMIKFACFLSHQERWNEASTLQDKVLMR